MVHPHDIFSLNEPWTIRIKKIAQELSNKGHEIKLVYFHLDSKGGNIKGVETISFSRNKWSVFNNALKMAELGKWADIIHFQKCFHYAALPALFSAYLNGKPIHYDWDDWEYMIYKSGGSPKWAGYYLNLFEKTIPKLVSTISVSSEYIKTLALSLGFDKDKIVYAHVGADLSLFNPKIGKSKIKDKYGISSPLVLYQGQLHGAQYAELFIKSAKRVLEKNQEVIFMIVGGGYDLKRLMNIAKLQNLYDKIIFTGPVEHEEVPGYIAAADVTVACFEDNCITKCKSPLKIAEYMASGKAVVASDVGEVRKMLGKAGLLTKPGDIDSLAEGILFLLNNNRLRHNLEKLSRKRAEKLYNWSVTADNLLKAYTIALNEK